MGAPRFERLIVLLSRWRIELAWLGVLAVPFVRPSAASIVEWLPLLAVGVAIRVWARGHLQRATEVTQSGPYALVRHPLYVGSFFIALAFALIARLPWFVPFVVLVFVVMYVPKALREEAWLRSRFGDTYDEYASRVGAVFPRRLPSLARLRSDFRWTRVLGHREWKTWVGVAGMLAFMWVRAITLAHQ